MTANPIKYNFFEVPTDLAPFVRYIWSFESQPNDGDYYIFRTYASPHPSLFFTYKGRLASTAPDTEINSNSFLLGQTKTWQRFKATGDFGIFGVTFYPFVLPFLFGIPAQQATDTILGLDTITDKDKTGIFNTISNCRDNETRYRATLELLRKQNFQPDPIARVIANLLQRDSGAAFDIEELVAQACMSRRNFERKFRHHSGYSPKSFGNVLRFQNALNRSVLDNATLMDTATELEYFDQAHLSNTFKRHSGFNPKQFSKPATPDNDILDHFVAFFQFLSICPPVLCRNKR